MGATGENGGPELNHHPDGYRPAQTLRRDWRVFWRGLQRIAAARNSSVNALLTEIDRQRDGNLSSAIRVYVFEKLTGERSLRSYTNGGNYRPL